MEIGDLWVDPADGMVMMYLGIDADQATHYVFFCPAYHDPEGDNLCYYSNYDLKFLEKIGG